MDKFKLQRRGFCFDSLSLLLTEIFFLEGLIGNLSEFIYLPRVVEQESNR